MLKRLGLLLGTFLLLLFVFGVYRIVTGTDTSVIPRKKIASPPIARIATSTSPSDTDAGLWLNLESRDKEGRLAAVYKAESWRRHKDGSITLAKPNVTLYQADGVRIVIVSDRGEIFAEELGKTNSFQVRRGRLIGGQDDKVHIDIVRAADREEQTIHILVEDVAIDNDLLQLTTDKSVEVRAAEADIYGKGLTMRWNEKPTELRDLRLAHGEKMIIRNIPEEFDAISLPGAGRAKKAASGPAGLSWLGTPSEGARVSQDLQMADDFPRPAKPPTSAPTPVKAKPAKNSEPAMNRFQADFTDEANGIVVAAGARTMSGAGSLSMNFNWDKADRSKSAKAASSKPGPRPSSTPATSSQPGQGEPMVITWSGPLVLKPIGHSDAAMRKDYEVTATGPRVRLTDRDTIAYCRTFRFESVGDQKPPKQTGELQGTDDQPARLELEQRTIIEAPLMKFDREGQIAELVGAGQMLTQGADSGVGILPAKSASGNGAKRQAASSPQGDMLASSTPATRAGEMHTTHAGETPTPLHTQKITWHDAVRVMFSEVPGSSSKQHIRNAEFRGKVHLQEQAGENGVGNYIQCDNLDVAMMPAQQGRDVRLPQDAHAWGHVKARQEASDITCRDLVVKFQEETIPTADGKGRSRSRPTDLTATGTDEEPVTVVDASDPAQPITATASKLVSKIDGRKADLFGTATQPAVVKQGKNEVQGPTIHVDNGPLGSGPNAPRKESLSVLGAGTAKFLSKQDLQGRALAEEKPVMATWSQRMEFEGYGPEDKNNKDLLVMLGDVKLVQEADTMHCGSMQVMFEKTPPKASAGGPSTGPAAATRPARARQTIAMQGMGRKAIERIVANNGVEMLSEKHDPEGRLTQLVRVTGKDLDYRVQNKGPGQKPDVTVDILGKGNLYSEDYRPPTSQPAGGESKMERPSQTAFAWKDSMHWVRAVPEGADAADGPKGAHAAQKSTVTFNGDVQMAHRSRDKVLMKQKLNVPPWPAKMENGRNAKIDCQQLIAVFAPAQEPTSKTPATAASPLEGLDMTGGMGQLEQFTAIRDVVMTENAMEVHAQQVAFKKAPPPERPDPNVVDSLEIWGYMGDEKPANATLVYQDASGKMMPPMTAPVIRCQLRGQQIVSAKAEKVSGSGGR